MGGGGKGGKGNNWTPSAYYKRCHSQRVLYPIGKMRLLDNHFQLLASEAESAALLVLRRASWPSTIPVNATITATGGAMLRRPGSDSLRLTVPSITLGLQLAETHADPV